MRLSEGTCDNHPSTYSFEYRYKMFLPVQLALWWSLFENASASVRSGDIFSGFIYLISGSNSTVGYIQGINGCMQVRMIFTPCSSFLMIVIAIRPFGLQDSPDLSSICGEVWGNDQAPQPPATPF